MLSLVEITVGLTRRQGAVLRQSLDRVGTWTALPKQDPCAIEALGLLSIGSARHCHKHTTVGSDLRRFGSDFLRFAGLWARLSAKKPWFGTGSPHPAGSHGRRKSGRGSCGPASGTLAPPAVGGGPAGLVRYCTGCGFAPGTEAECSLGSAGCSPDAAGLPEFQ